jgi:uroporphyrinogen-III synthase
MQRVFAEGYDAILLTSGNAARAAVDFLNSDHNLPVYAVGSATANALDKLAVAVFKTGSQGVDALVQAAAADGHRRLLWLAGEDHSDIPHNVGVSIDIAIVYRSAAVTTPDDFAHNVTQSDAVILHSSRAAAHFAGLCDAGNLPRDNITLATFSDMIAASAGDGWASIMVAEAPNDAALLDSIQRHFTMARCITERKATI